MFLRGLTALLFGLGTLQAPMAVDTAVKDAYARRFGMDVPRPAIFMRKAADGCREENVTTTAYLRDSSGRARLLAMSLSIDGVNIRYTREGTVKAPVGTFHVLAALVDHPDTVGPTGRQLWESAQQKINGDHVAFAAARGWRQPLVTFANTTVVIDPRELSDPRGPRIVRDDLRRNGIATDGYDFVAVINLDPDRGEGGFALDAEGFIYMGNFSHWNRPLNEHDWRIVANAVYHHEVAHHWGWQHGWAAPPGAAGFSASECRNDPDRPFIVPPVLFGWEDVDGDGVPEILDTTPYGRHR
jgi:hypothetical protein